MCEENSITPVYKTSRLKSLLKSRDYSDCSFIIDGEKIEAHKLILACSSPVFEKMFYGPLASKKDEIEILDTNALEFKQMLEFVYTDEVTLTSVPNAWNLYYLANKYMLEDLLTFCVTFIQKNSTLNTLSLSYELAEMYNESELGKLCWKDMTFYVKGVLLLDSEYHMKLQTLQGLLDDSAYLNDLDKFIGVLKWAHHECDQKRLDMSSRNIVNIIVDANLLKYVKLSKTQASKILQKSKKYKDLLLQDCVENLLDLNCYKGEEKNFVPEVLGFERPDYACRERQFYKISKQASLEEGSGFPSVLECNRKVALFGLVINTERETPDASRRTYDGIITISVKREGGQQENICARFSGKMVYDSTRYIPLDELIVLEANRAYRFKVSFTNLNMRRSMIVLYYYSHTLSHNNTVFSFFEECGSVIKGLCFYPV